MTQGSSLHMYPELCKDLVRMMAQRIVRRVQHVPVGV
jgi:hypothetical protein